MKLIHVILCLAFAAALVWFSLELQPASALKYGGLTLTGWLSVSASGLFLGFVVLLAGSRRRRLQASKRGSIRMLSEAELKELGVDKYRGPKYPHPVIFPDRCIGCQACVDACPHDVLDIVDGRAAAVAPDLCMEDTACQAECPVNPKACIVINTSRDVRSLPTPTRDGATYQTNVPGCYIIGDVSGVPLIKNAVKEGAEVITILASELASAASEPKAELDVAIIGIGPAGASAAVTAREAGLRYVAIEQDRVLSTIDLYPKGKYIFFKPDTKDWSGGISTVGLGLAKAKYGSSTGAGNYDAVLAEVGSQISSAVAPEVQRVHDLLLTKVPTAMREETSPVLYEKVEKELANRTAQYLQANGDGGWSARFAQTFMPAKDQLLPQFAAEITDQLAAKVPGDQRENILKVWLGNLADRGVAVNENESCKSVKRAKDGDFFEIQTEKGADKTPTRYTARRVVIAIGLRGAPNKLRLPNEDLKVEINGREEAKVIYGLSNPMDFRGKHLVVVGGGNVAVEAAVDLVAVRDGAEIKPRDPADMNKVTVLVRDYLAPTVKFGNKLQLYSCAEDGLIDLKFGVGIKEMRANELVLEDVKTKEVIGTIPNDFVFALIGGERPNRFLESIGIVIK